MNETFPAARGHFVAVSRFAKSRNPRPRQEWLTLWVAIFAGLFAAPAMAALTVTPATIDNAYNGTVVLAITGLNNAGQRVIVEKFLDVNDDNLLNGTDLLMQRFKVTDGQVTSVGGRRNINVPGDDDGLPGTSIQTKVYFTPGEIPGRLHGRYIFRVSPDGVGFTPFTNTLTVTKKVYGGSIISGRIMAGAVPQANAFVLITAGPADDFDVRGLTMTNAAGSFSLDIPPGSYRPVPVKTGFVFNLATSSLFTVNNGANTNTNDILLTARTRTITGLVRDNAGTPVALGGMLVFAAGDPGIFSFTFSDLNGNYTVDAGAGETELGVLEAQCATTGVIHAEAAGIPAGVVNLTGMNLTLPRPTALIYGNARTPAPANAAVPWLDIRGETDNPVELKSLSVTDSTGYYTLGVVIGDWEVGSETPGYIVVMDDVDVNLAGTNVLHDILVRTATAHLRGTVRNNQNQVVANLELHAHDYEGSTTFSVTDAGGNFDLPVYGGPGGTSKRWSLEINSGGSEPGEYIAPSVDYQVTDNNDINNINFGVYKVTAHLRGTVKDENDAPVTGVNIFATSQPGGVLTGGDAGGDGSFDVPVFGGTWKFGLSNDAGPGFLAQDNLQVTTPDNTDVNNLTFRVRHTNSTISGTLKNSQGTGLEGVNIHASVTISGAQFSTFTTTTAGGNYSLNVFSAATWHVTVNSSQPFQGYDPVTAQDVFVNGGNVTVNFTATTGGGGSTTFSSWRNANFTAAELIDPAISGGGADPDRDGVINLMEYALSMQPKSSDPAGLPVVATVLEAGPTRYLTLTFRQLKNATGLAYNVQEAPAFNGSWTSVQASFEQVSSDATTNTLRAKTPITPGTKKFMRLVVVQQP